MPVSAVRASKFLCLHSSFPEWSERSQFGYRLAHELVDELEEFQL